MSRQNQNTGQTNTGVDSSCLAGVKHNGKRTLEVEFTSGARYSYSGVSPRVATNLRRAESVGRHFVRNVRNAYPVHKISGPPSRRS